MAELIVHVLVFAVRDPDWHAVALLAKLPLDVAPQALLERVCIRPNGAYPKFLAQTVLDARDGVLEPTITEGIAVDVPRLRVGGDGVMAGS